MEATAKVVVAKALLLEQQEDTEEAMKLAIEAQESFQRLGDNRGQAAAGMVLAQILLFKEDEEGAIETGKISEAMFGMAGDSKSQAESAQFVELIVSKGQGYDGKLGAASRKKAAAAAAKVTPKDKLVRTEHQIQYGPGLKFMYFHEFSGRELRAAPGQEGKKREGGSSSGASGSAPRAGGQNSGGSLYNVSWSGA